MLRIMVVDDEALVRNGLCEDTDWKSMDAEVVAAASNGQQALQLYHELKPDVIISDIRMPKMDGIEMLQQLRDEGSDVQVIYLSAYDEFEYARDALRLLAADYLLKPFEDEQLSKAVEKVRKKINVSEPDPSENGNRYVRSAISCIEKNYSDPCLSVTSIAEEIGISDGHISRLFRKETGQTIASYITHYRMDKACQLLGNVHYKVYEVALMVGYSDVNYFSSLFRKNMKMTPSQWQNSHQQ